MGRHHVRIFSTLTNVDLLGVSDLDRNNLTELERLYSVATFLDYRDMEGMVDAVSVAVPTSQHYEIAKFFMERGVHVLIEKPLARTVEEAKKLIEIGSLYDVKLQVGHIERFNPAVKVLPSILKNEKMISVSSERLGPYNPRVEDINVIYDLMIHDLDITLNLVGSEVSNMSAVGKRVISSEIDYATAHLSFRNGVIASLTSSRVTPQKVRRLAITTKDAFIEVDYTTSDVSIYRNTVPEYADFGYRQSGIIEKPYVQYEEPLRLELSSFIRCITLDEKPAVTGEDGLKALSIAEELNRMCEQV